MNETNAMLTNPNIFLIGLGGIGASYAAQAQEHGFDIPFICDVERKERYATSDFVVNGKAHSFSYVTHPNERGLADLLLIAVKFNQLHDAIEAAKPFIGENTIILSLLNGINSEQIVLANINKGHILHAFVNGTDGYRKGHTVRYSSKGKIAFGAINDGEQSLVKKATTMLRSTGIQLEIADDIRYRMWWKFMVNIGFNPTGVILNAPYKHFQVEGPAKELAIMGMREAIKIANALSIPLGEDDITKAFELLNRLSGENKISMLQDIEAGRKTENDMLSGEIIRLGRELNIPTPVNDVFYQTVKFIEERSS